MFSNLLKVPAIYIFFMLILPSTSSVSGQELISHQSNNQNSEYITNKTKIIEKHIQRCESSLNGALELRYKLLYHINVIKNSEIISAIEKFPDMLLNHLKSCMLLFNIIRKKSSIMNIIKRDVQSNRIYKNTLKNKQISINILNYTKKLEQIYIIWANSIKEIINTHGGHLKRLEDIIKQHPEIAKDVGLKDNYTRWLYMLECDIAYLLKEAAKLKNLYTKDIISESVENLITEEVEEPRQNEEPGQRKANPEQQVTAKAKTHLTHYPNASTKAKPFYKKIWIWMALFIAIVCLVCIMVFPYKHYFFGFIVHSYERLS